MVGKVYDRINNLKKIGTKTEIKQIDALLRIREEEIVYMPPAEIASAVDVAETSLSWFC